jgi:hypothetical protein
MITTKTHIAKRKNKQRDVTKAATRLGEPVPVHTDSGLREGTGLDETDPNPLERRYTKNGD